MKPSVSVLTWLNRCFPQQKHPFNMENDGSKTYAQWQYEKGRDTIAFYLERYAAEEMFCGKTVLDMGCGAAGKSLYYASLGAKQVTGVDVVPSYQEEAEALAKQLGFADRFTFLLGDAACLPLPDGSIDTILMNDFMEHVAQPEKALAEAMRVLTEKGRIYINFPPYYHPFGAHLSDVIGIPWVHLLFSEHTLTQAYRTLTADKPDGAQRVAFRISQDRQGNDYFSYINHMTIKRFGRMLHSLHITPAYYKEVPLRRFLKPLAQFPPTRECFVKMVVCVLEKQPLSAAAEPNKKLLPHV